MTISCLSDPLTFKNNVQAENSENFACLLCRDSALSILKLGFFLQEAISQMYVSVENFPSVKIKLRIQETCVLPWNENVTF